MSVAKLWAASGTLVALCLLPRLVASYDCSQLSTMDQLCPMNGPGPTPQYPICQVKKLSVSAFIQCADDTKGPDAPQFQLPDEDSDVGPLELLSKALDTPRCDACPLAGRLIQAANSYNKLGDFGNYLCNTLHPVDAGMCCLRKCLNGVLQEHSIEAFCNGNRGDLTMAPLVPNNCKPNGNVDSGASGNGDSGNSDPSNDDGDSSSSTGAAASSSTDESENTTPSTTSSTMSTTSAAANDATTSSTTSTSTTPQTTPSSGADSGRLAIYGDRMKRLGIAAIPILAAF
ncbi:hypothetical protein G7Y79_00002g005480 [Physcia stellaris]|nr:hypothetical protein G7Y79_00002g005480 [Physcia stellaris]